MCKDAHSAVLWILWARLTLVLVSTMMQQDVYCIRGILIHYYSLPCLQAAYVSPWVLSIPSKSFRPRKTIKRKKHCVELTCLNSPLHKAMPLLLIGMSPSWLLPEISEYRPHALVFAGYLKLICVFLIHFPFWNVHL